MGSVATAPHNTAGHAHHAEHHHEESFVSKYVFSHDHKMISKQFLITAIIMACVAVMMSVFFRLQLAWPGEGFAITNFFLGDKWAPNGVLDPNMYLGLITIHGTIMVFFVLTGGLSGTFSNLLIPLDVRTILLLMAFTAVPTALVLLAISRFYASRVPGVGYWNGANLALAIGLVILSLSKTANDLPARVLGNTLLVLTAALYYLAIQRLLGDTPSKRLASATVAASGIVFALLWASAVPYRLAVGALCPSP